MEKYKKELKEYSNWFKTIEADIGAKTAKDLIEKISDSNWEKLIAWCNELNNMTIVFGLTADEINAIDTKILS